MYTQHGEIEGVKWLSLYKGGREFVLYVGSLKKPYRCQYEPIFGVDISDYACMNGFMDEMQERILNEGLDKQSDELDELLEGLK